jgi:hypothetical protein
LTLIQFIVVDQQKEGGRTGRMRASQRTKMVKPPATAAEGQAENRTELKREVLVEEREVELRTPTKRRRVLRSSEQDSADSTSRIEDGESEELTWSL